MPLVRCWVVAAELATAVVAGRFVRAAAGLALWASRTLGTTDAESVLVPANVEYYTMVACADRALSGGSGREQGGASTTRPREALLLGVLLAGEEKKNYLRSDVCAVLDGLDAAVAYTLGLCDGDTWGPVSYHITQKQLRRLELAVRDGWTSPGGEDRDLAWVTRTLLDATIPRDRRRSITALALDSTFVETWAVTQDFTPDAVAQHRLAARQTPELAEPEPQQPQASGADPDARSG